MNQDTFITRNADNARLRYHYARMTLRIKAAELRPLRRAGRIPLWRDLESQYAHTALNRRREYYEALRLNAAVIARRNEQIESINQSVTQVDRYLAPDLTPRVMGVALGLMGLLSLVAIFCAVGVCS